MIYKFVTWDILPLETLKNAAVQRWYNELQEGKELSQNDKNDLFSDLQDNTYSKIGVPLHGWMFDFLPWLKTYWVKLKTGIIEVYALDKSSIRAYYGRSVVKIVEISGNKEVHGLEPDCIIVDEARP